MIRPFIFFALSFVVLSCSSELDSFSKTKVFNTDVADSLLNIKKELNLVRTELQLEGGKKVNSCEAYSKEIKASKITEGVNNQLVKSEYLICDVLMLLGNQQYSVVSTDINMSNMLAGKLDLRTFPSSLGPLLDDKNYTIKSIAGKNLFIKENSVVYETDDWSYKLEIIALSDVNNNQKEDWIIWFTDESKVGSYQTLVLYDVDSSKNLKAAQSH